MKNLILSVILFGLFAPGLAWAAIPVNLNEKLKRADLVLLSASQGRVLVALEGKNLLLKQATKDVRHATVVASHFEGPSVTIKTKGEMTYLNCKIIDGKITIDGVEVDVEELIKRYKAPKNLIPSIFLKPEQR